MGCELGLLVNWLLVTSVLPLLPHAQSHDVDFSHLWEEQSTAGKRFLWKLAAFWGAASRVGETSVSGDG